MTQQIQLQQSALDQFAHEFFLLNRASLLEWRDSHLTNYAGLTARNRMSPENFQETVRVIDQAVEQRWEQLISWMNEFKAAHAAQDRKIPVLNVNILAPPPAPVYDWEIKRDAEGLATHVVSTEVKP